MIGIYRILNRDNGKSYVGQSQDISHRKACHFYDLKNNVHKNPVLQADYNKNPNAFEFEILCKCKVEDLDDLERYFIQKYNSMNDGYNLSDGGIVGARFIAETINRMSKAKMGNQAMKGLKLSEKWKKHISEAQPHRKRVICVETGETFESFADAARKTGLNRTKIVSCCTGKRNTTGGLHFQYDKETGN